MTTDPNWGKQIEPNPSVYNPPALTSPPTPTAPFTTAQLQSYVAFFIDEFLAQVLLAVAGIQVFGIKPFAGLTTWAQQLEQLAQDALTGANTSLDFWNFLLTDLGFPESDITAFTTWLSAAQTDASNAWTQIQAFLTTGDWSDLTAAIQDIYQAIFGSSIQLGLLGLIPAPAVVNVTQNLQPVWDFPDAASVSAGAQWSWDGTVDHTGAAGSGSAKVVANGVLQALKGVPGSVQPGQTVAPTAFVTWSGLSAAAGTHPIQLQLTPYSTSGSELVAATSFEVAQITSPGASSSTYPGAVLVDGLWWVELTGSYTVPSSGVTAVQSRVVVTADATAGTINFDDCAVNVTGGFLPALQDVVTTLDADFTANNTAFATFLQNALATIEAGGSFSTIISALETEWTTYTTTVSGLLSSEIFTIQQLLNSLLGIDTGTGLLPQTQVNGLTAIWNGIFGTTTPTGASQIEQSAINGLATTLSALLGTTTFQSLLDAVANVLGHSGAGHSISDIETYLGIIPPANVTNVLGGANLGADVSSVHSTIGTQGGWLGRLLTDVTILFDVFHTTYTSTQWNNAWTDLMALVGLTNSTTAPSNPTPTIGTAINNNTSTLNTTNTNLFGSTTPGTAIQTSAVPSGIAATKISNVLGGTDLGADVSSVHSTATTNSTNVTNTWSWLFGTTTPTSATQVVPTKVSNVLGGASLAADVQAILDNIANALGHSGTGHTLVQIESYLGLIPPANVTNVLGGANLAADVSSVNSTASTNLTNINNTWSWLFGTTSPTSATPVQSTKVANVLGGTSLGADVSAVSTKATNGTAWATRLTNDLAILLDVFHLTYTSTQWNTAWSDLMSLLGIVNSTTTPTNPTPTIGTSITTAQSTANTASSAASTAQSGAQATADGIHQAINNDTSTGTSLTASAVKSNLQTIPHVNIQQGVFARVTRLTTSTGPSWSSGQIPTSTYDSSVVTNSNITFVSGRSFQVALAGTYFFNFSFVGSVTTSPDIVNPQFYINGSLARTYPTIWVPSFVASGLFGQGAVIELGVNDTITPGFNHTGTWAVTNDTTGSMQNSMEIALLTRN